MGPVVVSVCRFPAETGEAGVHVLLAVVTEMCGRMGAGVLSALSVPSCFLSIETFCWFLPIERIRFHVGCLTDALISVLNF